MLAAALRYAELGWPMLPLESGGKRPAGRLAPHGLKDATTDAETLRQWWGELPAANIGLRTGDRFHVLDVDGFAGRRRARDLFVEYDYRHAGPIACTPGYGRHFYFAPLELGNRAGFVEHCDWRGDGGYVVAPPSRTDTGTTRYWWYRTPVHPLPGVPEWLVELLAPARPRVPVLAFRMPRRRIETGYGDAALAGELDQVRAAPVGTRNHTLNAAAFSLGQLVGARVLEAEHVARELLVAATTVGLSESEAVATIRSGLAAGVAEPRSFPNVG